MATTTHDAAGSDPILILQSNGGGTDKLNVNSSGQVQNSDGSVATPSMSFKDDVNTGIYRIGNDSIGISANGSLQIEITDNDQVKLHQKLRIVDGSESAPGLSFGSDTDTGIYRLGTNAIAMTFGGVKRWELDPAIGITTIEKTFLPSGSESSLPLSFTGDTDTGIYRPGNNMLGFVTNGINALVIKGSTIGIGTNDPDALLEVNGGQSIPSLRLRYNAPNPDSWWEMRIDSSDVRYLKFRYLDGNSNIQGGPIFEGDSINTGYLRGPQGSNGGGQIQARANNYRISMDYDGSDLKFYQHGSGTAIKTFIINHPSDQKKYLVHGTLEGPEAAVYYRGTGRLMNGEADVILPNYFEKLTSEMERTIILTNVDGFDKLMVKKINGEKIKNGIFKVISENPDSKQEFDWEVKAIRKDVERLKVEPFKSDIDVYGQGPYTFAKKRELEKV